MFTSSSKTLNWSNPSSVEELDTLANDTSLPLLIFKHSERCPVSRMALKQFENEFNLEGVRLAFIEVRENRELSNHIAEKWNIDHQSPQALIQDTKGNHISFSHNGIDVDKIKSFLGL